MSHQGRFESAGLYYCCCCYSYHYLNLLNCKFMKPVSILHFLTWMSALSLVSSMRENGVVEQILSLCDKDTLDKRLPARSLNAGREISSKIPLIISMLWFVVFQETWTKTVRRKKDKNNNKSRCFVAIGQINMTMASTVTPQNTHRKAFKTDVVQDVFSSIEFLPSILEFQEK